MFVTHTNIPSTPPSSLGSIMTKEKKKEEKLERKERIEFRKWKYPSFFLYVVCVI